jgi:hypothetical protein
VTRRQVNSPRRKPPRQATLGPTNPPPPHGATARSQACRRRSTSPAISAAAPRRKATPDAESLRPAGSIARLGVAVAAAGGCSGFLGNRDVFLIVSMTAAFSSILGQNVD